MNSPMPAQRLIRLAASPTTMRRVRFVLSAIFLAALVMVLARWTWFLLPAAPEDPQTAPGAQAPANPHPMPSPLQSIASARLWGELPPSAPSPSTTRDTRLPLSLRGILSGEGLAMIETSGRGTLVYRVGDTLPGGAVLKDVLADHVLIDRAGVIERLALPKQALDAQALHTAEIAQPATGSTPVNLGKMLQQSPAELSKEFRLSPVTEGGKLRGYRLRALRNPEMLQRAGLETDDVLISVNGTSLTQANDLPKFIKDLRSAAAIDAVVLRHGREIPLHLDLNATP